MNDEEWTGFASGKKFTEDYDKVQFKDIIDVPIHVFNWAIKESDIEEGKEYIALFFQYKGNTDKNCKTYTSSTVMIKQLKQEQPPKEFDTTIKKHQMNNTRFYYYFT